MHPLRTCLGDFSKRGLTSLSFHSLHRQYQPAGDQVFKHTSLRRHLDQNHNRWLFPGQRLLSQGLLLLMFQPIDPLPYFLSDLGPILDFHYSKPLLGDHVFSTHWIVLKDMWLLYCKPDLWSNGNPNVDYFLAPADCVILTKEYSFSDPQVKCRDFNSVLRTKINLECY